MKVLLITLLAFSSVASAQYAASVSGSTTAAAEINGKINHQEGSGAPSSLNCTLGKDLYTDTGTTSLYKCSVTGTPGTWVRIRDVVTNAQTGTTYTVLTGDYTKVLTLSNASAVAVTLPQATGLFGSGYWFIAKNIGAGLVTITPTTSTISGAATITLATGEYAFISSDGTNYEAESNHIVQGTNVTITPSRIGPTIASAGGGGTDYSTTSYNHDDFNCGAFTTGTIGCLGWFLSASGFASGSANSIAGSPGLLTLTTSATINSVVGIAPVATTSNLVAAESFVLRTKVASITGTAPTTNIRLRIGLTTQYAAPDSISNGMYLEKLEGDTNWFCVVNGASGNSRTDTTVAFVTTEFAVQIRRIDSAHIGCKVATKLSGLAGASEVSSAATEPITDMTPFIMVKNTAAEVKLVNIDFWDLSITGLNR